MIVLDLFCEDGVAAIEIEAQIRAVVTWIGLPALLQKRMSTRLEFESVKLA